MNPDSRSTISHRGNKLQPQVVDTKRKPQERKSRKASPASANSKDGKIKLIRESSGTNFNEHLTKARQVGLLTGAILLTAHAFYFLSSTVGAQHGEFNLQKAPMWESIGVVWSSGWITAAATGLGAIPFVLVNELSPRLIAVCNAVAAGMMMAAALGLIIEGCLESTTSDTVFYPAVRVLIGASLGVGFVKLSSHIVEEKGDPTEALQDIADREIEEFDMKRAMVIMAVMTLHSFTEGVGIGVSYHSQTLGGFISATLAVHNIPEGIAVAIVLIPRGFSLLATALWCIFSSLPQPLMAVPAYIFVDYFRFITPIGFGFSAGAMGFVSLFELLSEAKEKLSPLEAHTIMGCAMVAMGCTQMALRDHTM